MDPFSLIGGVASGALGYFAQQSADEQNYKMALFNYYQEEARRRQAIQQAEKIRSEQKLGATDAAGNRTHFVEGVGWVSDLSEKGQRMQDAQDKEQMQVLTHDLPARRAKMDENIQSQIPERAQANALLDMFRNRIVNRPTDEATEAWMRDARTRGVSEAADASQDNAMRGVIRSGSSNAGKVAAESQKARQKALADAFLDAKLGAKDYGRNALAQELAGLGNSYNMFATRASQMPGVSYQPQNLEGNADSLMKAFADNAQQGNGLAATAYGDPVRAVDYKQEPNYGIANTVQQFGGGLSDMFKQNSLDERLKKSGGYSL